VLGTIKGTPAPADQVLLASPDLVNPDLVNLTDTLPVEQRYSFVFNGNAQTLDHILVNNNANARVTRYAVSRNNGDFPNAFRSDATRPERVSDHDMPVAYFTLNAAPVANAPVLISEFRFNGPGGTGDEFIELYNNTDAAVNVQGWTISAPAGTGGGGVVIGGSGIIPARGHYLVATSGYSASGIPRESGELPHRMKLTRARRFRMMEEQGSQTSMAMSSTWSGSVQPLRMVSGKAQVYYRRAACRLQEASSSVSCAGWQRPYRRTPTITRRISCSSQLPAQSAASQPCSVLRGRRTFRVPSRETARSRPR
jgi:hypothetical protein